MAEPPQTSESKPPTTPRWVKVLGMITLVAVLLVVVMMVASGGQHGPSRHAPGGDAPASQAPPAGGHALPAGLPTHL